MRGAGFPLCTTALSWILSPARRAPRQVWILALHRLGQRWARTSLSLRPVPPAMPPPPPPLPPPPPPPPPRAEPLPSRQAQKAGCGSGPPGVRTACEAAASAMAPAAASLRARMDRCEPLGAAAALPDVSALAALSCARCRRPHSSHCHRPCSSQYIDCPRPATYTTMSASLAGRHQAWPLTHPANFHAPAAAVPGACLLPCSCKAHDSMSACINLPCAPSGTRAGQPALPVAQQLVTPAALP